MKELSLAKATAMTSPPAIPPEEGTTTMATTEPRPDDNPNIDKLTAVGSTEDGPQNAKTKPEQETGQEDKGATAAVAQMFDLAAIGELQLAENGVAPAPEPVFAQNMNPYPMTTAQDLEALAALAPLFDSNIALNQLGQNPYTGMHLGIGNSLAQQPFLDPSPYIPEPQETQVSAYAKLEFEDGEFYMNTFSVILGRDQVAARRARKREVKQQLREEKALQEFGQDPRTPVQIKREESRYSKSIVSESGGIMRDGDDPDPEKRRQRRMGKARKSSKPSRSDSSSHSSSKRNSYFPSNTRIVYEPQPRPLSNRYAAPMTDSAVPVDPDSLRPDPSGCPLIGIHPNVTKGSGSYKNISREHVKISFNSDEHVFEAHMIGRNGAFFDRDSCDSHNMQHYPVGTKVTLTSGCYLQIADVRVRFVLPDVRHGETGAERPDYAEEEVVRCYSEGGKEMSFDFEDDPRPVPADSDDEDDSEEDRSGEDDDRHQGEEFSEDDGNGEREEGDDGGDEEEDDDDDGQEGDQLTPNNDFEDEEKPTLSQHSEPLQQSPKVEKKRGPGRPPKDGIMSKREKQLAKKLEQEALAQAQSGGKGVKTTASKTTVSKTTAGKTTASKAPAPTAASTVGPDGQAPPVKNKVGRPRKHPLPETPIEPRQKRKYTKRKPKESKEGEVKQEGSGGDNPATPAKKEKPPKEPQSPPLVLIEADYTEEQLQKPGANYVQLIFEALSNHPDGQMTLPQIYKAIERRYPWFHFKAQTNGWQSSVRHNLGQNTSFIKVTREGKGWKWALAPGATIDKEKKRRAPSPPQAPPGQMQPIYSNAYQMIPGQPYGFPHGMGPQGYHPYGPPPNMPPGQYPYMGPPPPHLNGHPHHPGPYSMGPPVGVPAIMPPQLAAPNAPSSYSSPYAPKPASANESQPGEQIRQTEQRLPTEEQNDNQGPPSHGHTPQLSLPQSQQPQTAPPLQPQATQSVSQQTLQTPPQPPQAPPSEGFKTQPSPSIANAATLAAVKKFKEIVMGTATKRPNIEDIIDSASSQVLGRHNRSSLPEADHKYELQIKEALISMLRKMPDTNLSELLSTKAPGDQNDQGGPAPHVPAPDANQNRTQASAPPPPQQPTNTTGSEILAPSIMRPQFNGHSHSHPPQIRANISIPRPPIMGPNNAMKRTNSGSPAPWGNTGSGSPAKRVSNGASAPVLAANENGGSVQIAGQKRTHDEATPSDADDMREFKRLSTSGPPQVKT